MDKTEQAIRRTLAAIDAPLYDIGILNERGMYPRLDGLTAAHVQRSIPYLRYRNTQGAHVFFRPSGEHRFTVLDDLTRTILARLVAEGFAPCAVIETSPGNFQAWRKHAGVLSKPLSSFAARTIAVRYGADPSAADWRRFGRFPGLTNRKPIHRSPAGYFPLARLVGSTGKQYTQADTFQREIFQQYKQQQEERTIRRLNFQPNRTSYSITVSRFRNAVKYANRPAAADMAFSIAAFATGWPEHQIAAALANDYLSRDNSESRRTAYIRRTLAKASLWAGA